MLFIVSQVTLDTAGPDGVSVSVLRAEGEKCERCWRIVSDISRDAGFAGLCGRCVAALPAGDGGREVA
jgi:isoleucyl-tRNA synthetase